jgi:hypothetical protein
VSPVSGTNNRTITVTANTANTGTSWKSATVIIAGLGVITRTVSVTQVGTGTYLTVSPSIVSVGSASGSYGTFTISSNTNWSITDDASWLDVLPAGGLFDGTPRVTANSANTGTIPRSATVTIAGTGVTPNKTVTVTQLPSGKTLGNTDVYSSSSTLSNRRALPITFTEAGTIQSISIYHNGGTGNVLLGVYSDASAAPTSLLGVTPSTVINPAEGWQTVALTSPVPVPSGQTVWLAWVFQTTPGVRYITGTPARAQSSASWAGGMPSTFGSATYANYKFSIYCTYTAGVAPYLTVSPTTVTIGSASGSSGTFSISSNVTWTVTDNVSWLSVSPVSGSNNATITVTAGSANTGTSTRSATVTIAGTVVASKTVIVTQEAPPPPDGKTLGNTTVYSLSSTTANRRALPITFTEAGTIQSISIYHNGGIGSVYLGVYANASGSPAARLGVTPSTVINSAAGWQTVYLNSPVSVASGQTVWLAWVFETNPGIRYITGTPARAESPASWPGGMPNPFGTATYGNYKYSVYCNYTTGGTGTLGNTTVYSSSSTTANRRALPVTFTEAGKIQSVSIYHNGGTGNVLLGVYSNVSGAPTTLLGVTPSTVINPAAGWQTVALNSPVTVTSGQTVWLSWVFQTNPGIRYITGTPARAESPALWAGGMPATFGTATFGNYKYSIYCTYTTGAGVAKSSGDQLGINSNEQNKEMMSIDPNTADIRKEKVLIYPNPTEGSITVKWETFYGNRLKLTIYNIIGNPVKTVQIEPDINEIQVDLNDIKGGIYLFELKDIKNGLIINRSRVIKQ